ncbi:MAG: hypothetical protein M1818_005056 [Claussenomyces sp. TS43310]|nr:MAG: hypothetical protein M1818_005056 [Claussenomyces sp. TS43310]
MKATTSNKTAQNYNAASANNSSFLIEKLNARRSTPDSEALASSDDEIDSHRQEQQPLNAPTQKPTRRASWLNDTTQSQPRKGSFPSSSMSPTTSHPGTPSAETGPWSTGIARGVPGSNSFPWTTGIWNSDTRKEPPSRLTEVLPESHPVPTFKTNGSTSYISSQARDAHEATIPFAIPLHPTPKTYRSQSYSVGQLDPDTAAAGSSHAAITSFNGRSRIAPNASGLQHRPSRPSMLSEMANDGIGLGKVKEVEDDEDDGNNGSLKVSRVQMDQARAIEELARENAILRHQSLNNSRLRSRSSTSNNALGHYGLGHSYALRDSLPEESEYAVDELDEVNELQELKSKGLLGRRLSEYGTATFPGSSAYAALENRKLESVKKAYWQSSLGFGGPGDIPQSRRHSFADVPARHDSVSSIGELSRDPLSQESLSSQESQPSYPDSTGYQIGDHAIPYFGGGTLPGRASDPIVPPNYPMSVYQSYAMNTRYLPGRSSSPQRSMHTASQPHQNQLLYIVLFKCSRADVFYVQEGTGLSIKPGDLVIVEADRGTDLGTVAQENVDWAQAKELKDHYAEEHYKWLMMYSQGAAGTSDGTGAGLMAASNGLQGSAVGGMGPANQHGLQEPLSAGEVKPKIIKRLAQPHEIQSLRDKEGNEAKAKRVCMQKVKEHGLHMEILDAEFQMDWKKLTFYYFADAYINFNSLVTDLFKVYKTRIWMSAINPASFASPNLGLQVPSGIGPGAVGINRSAQVDRRSQPLEQGHYNSTAQEGRSYIGVGGTYNSATNRGQMSPASFQQHGISYGYSPFTAARTSGVSKDDYATNTTPHVDPFAAYSNAPEYPSLTARFASSQSGEASQDHSTYTRQASGISAGSDAWINTMQTLSLNSR